MTKSRTNHPLLLPHFLDALTQSLNMPIPRCTSLHSTDFFTYQCELGEGHAEKHTARYKDTDQTPREKSNFIKWSNPTRELKKRMTPFVGWRCWKLMSESCRFDNVYNKVQYTERDTTDYFLLSTAAAVKWEGPVMRTRDNVRVSGRNLAGMAGSRKQSFGEEVVDYGVYSYNDPRWLLHYFYGDIYHDPNTLITQYPIIGRLDVTGHVIEHELGFRSQVVTIRELWISDQIGRANTDSFTDNKHIIERETPKVQEVFESRYHCPVHIYDFSKLKSWADYMAEEYRSHNQVEGV